MYFLLYIIIFLDVYANDTLHDYLHAAKRSRISVVNEEGRGPKEEI